MATLDEWENRLKPLMAEIDLIGELDLTQEQTQEIGTLIRALIRRSVDFHRATTVLRQSYPRCFTAFLVFQGLYGYNEGDYWSAVCQATGLPPGYTAFWGQTFEEAVTVLGLRRQFAGHRYVGTILGHGGIPARSLPDFFDRMLQPSITKPEWAGLTVRELIDEWLAGSARYFVDKPVLRFLEYGGQVAEDLVERLRQLAREYLATGEMPSAGDVGLSEPLRTRYQEWIEAQGRVSSSRAAGPRLRRPLMMLDPWGLGVMLWFPEQHIPVAQSHGKIVWRIVSDGRVTELPLRPRRVDFDLKTEARHLPLEQPASAWQASLLADDRLLQEWTLAGVSPEQPLLVFDPVRRTPVPVSGQKQLPGQSLWVIAAPDVKLDCNPSKERFVKERLPQLPWGWQGWQAVTVDLAQVCEFWWQSSAQGHKIWVNEVDLAQQPELVGGTLIESLAETTPLYVGQPPKVKIPWRNNDRSDNTLARWRLEVRSDWEAEPTRSISARLSEVRGLLQWTGDAIELSLNEPALLGESPVGMFMVRVRGPLGNAAELRFRILRQLSLVGHEQAYVPAGSQGAAPVELLIETDAHSELQFLQHEPAFGFELATEDSQVRYYKVEVPPDRTEAPLRLVHHLGPARSVYIPLRVPIKRLRWLLILDPAKLIQPAWSSRPETISLEEFEQSEFPYLLVDVPGGEDITAAVSLRFLDREGETLQELTAPTPSVPSRFRRFDLRLARDTIRQSQSALVRAQLTVRGVPGHERIDLPAFNLRQGIVVDEVETTTEQLDGVVRVTLSWRPPIPLKGRYVRFWSQSCPWRPPIGFGLPDGARQGYTAELPADALPAGQYLTEFTVRDPWLPESTPERPTSTAGNVAQVVLGDLAQRASQLSDGQGEGVLDFDKRCERLLLRRVLGDRSSADQDLQWCYDHIQDASVEQLMALDQELGKDNPTAKAIRMKLYRSERVQSMLDAYRKGTVSEERLRIYLADVPNIALQSAQTCKILLDAPDDRLRLAAAGTLIRQREIAGLEAILAWTEKGELSDASALELIETNLPFATDVISAMPSTPLMMRLWEALLRRHPDKIRVLFVRPGYWVRSSAGWGRIERIETPLSTESAMASYGDLSKGYRLHVILRPGEDAERVVLDIAKHEIQFVGSATIYQCAVCRSCATRDEGLLYHRHKKIAHQGEVFGLAPAHKSLPQIARLVFSVGKPVQVWA